VPGAATYTIFIDDYPSVTDIVFPRSAPGNLNKQVPGLTYKWEVAAVDPNGIVGTKSATIFTNPAPLSTFGVKHALVALVDFTDWDVPFDASTVVPFTDKLHQWYIDESDGQFEIDFTVTDWREIPRTLESVGTPFLINVVDGTRYGVAFLAQQAALPYFPEAADYDYVVWVQNGVGEVGFGGGGAVLLSAQHSMTPGVWLHELGHNLSLMHTGGTRARPPETSPMWADLLNPDPNRWFLCRYCSDIDPMGSVAYQDIDDPILSYSAFKKVVLGWADLSDIQWVEPWGGQFTIAPVEDPALHQKIMVGYPLGGIKGMFYEVEYRKAIGQAVVLIHTPMMGGPWGDVDMYQVGPPLGVGESFYDQARGIRITLAGAGADWASVRIATPIAPPAKHRGRRPRLVEMP